MASFSDRLKELRNSKHAMQKDLAEYLGISVRAYQHYETGTRFPDFHGIQKLADFFEVSTDYLLGRTNYSVDANGHISAKVPPDILNLDTNELAKDSDKE